VCPDFWITLYICISRTLITLAIYIKHSLIPEFFPLSHASGDDIYFEASRHSTRIIALRNPLLYSESVHQIILVTEAVGKRCKISHNVSIVGIIAGANNFISLN
jgi:hypothetical protein